jgi:hypothetical protein
VCTIISYEPRRNVPAFAVSLDFGKLAFLAHILIFFLCFISVVLIMTSCIIMLYYLILIMYKTFRF